MYPTYETIDLNTDQSHQEDRKLFLMSGGLDSTYMILEELESGNNIDILTIYCGQDVNKYKREKQAIKDILNALKEIKNEKDKKDIKFGKVIKWFVVDDGLDFRGGILNNHVCLCQPPSWIITSIYVLQPYHASLNIGYITGDSIIGMLDYLVYIFENLTYITFGKTTNLLFPLCRPNGNVMAARTKEQVVNALKDRDLYHLVWTCEFPYERNNEIIECGDCHPCRTKRAYDERFNRKMFKLHAVSLDTETYDEENKDQLNLPPIPKLLVSKSEYIDNKEITDEACESEPQ